MKEKKSLFIFIPIIIDSLNKTNTKHWTKKHAEKKHAEIIIYKALENFSDDIKFNKVHISFQCVLGQETGFKISKSGKKVKVRNKTSRDIINNAPSIKLIEDCIVRSGLLEDDTNEYVTGHTIYADIVDRKIEGSGMMILIEEVGSDKSKLNKYFNTNVKEKYKLKK